MASATKTRLTILTRTPGFHPFSKEFIASIVKKILGRVRGPEAVTRSLVSGLSELQVSFNINPLLTSSISETVVVLSSVSALKKALELKSQGKIKYIFAGPNVLVSSKDENGLLENPAINAVIVNSDWTRDHILTLSPQLKDKLIIWPCGVVLPPLTHSKKESQRADVVIYRKQVPEEVLREVLAYMQEINQPYTLLTYGMFSQKKYFDTLTKARVMIYLQKSESQGLAIFEAWARSVPTINYEHGVFEDKDFLTNRIQTKGKISAPYISSQSGITFKAGEFAQAWKDFIAQEKTFNPRLYIEQNFTDKITAQNLLNQIKQYES